MNIHKIILLVCASFLVHTKPATAQNIDLGKYKEWTQLMQMNPALTSYTKELRTLILSGQGLNIGLESPLFGSQWNTGAFFVRESAEQLLRNRVDIFLARAFKTKQGAQLHIGLNGQWNQKQFYERLLDAYSISDFNGMVYQIDSSVKSQITGLQHYLDAGAGFSYQKNNLLIGFNARHLTRPNVSILKNRQVREELELGFQLGGFITGKGDTRWFPAAVVSMQGNEHYWQLGMNYVRKSLSFGTHYEQWEDFRYLSARVNFRKGPVFLSAQYAQDFTEELPFNRDLVQLVINFSFLRKKELDGFQTLLRKLN